MTKAEIIELRKAYVKELKHLDRLIDKYGEESVKAHCKGDEETSKEYNRICLSLIEEYKRVDEEYYNLGKEELKAI